MFQNVQPERLVKPIISPRELAAAIGVSESSLKRWADDGVIQVTKTAGGHRRITIGEAIRFVRAVRAPLLRPDLLGLSDLSPLGDDIVSADRPVDRLLRYLREGKAREARALVLSAYLAGQSVAEIADGPIREAMEEIGKLWQHDPSGVYVEHRATDICVQAARRWASRHRRGGPRRSISASVDVGRGGAFG
jgi:MerR family transcriptional regulator, light-induced transcriptional regulator